jgi:putative hydrolase of the HAD superfamily
MIFYRSPRRFRAVTLDLDDTLYDNRPVIARAERLFMEYLTGRFSVLRNFSRAEYGDIRSWLYELDPLLRRDVSLARLEIVKKALTLHGVPEDDAAAGAREALARFVRVRSEFRVPEESIEAVRKIAARIPTAALTNGNVDYEEIGLGGIFRTVVRSGRDVPPKPDRAMFDEAARRLGVRTSDILHVGDDPRTDVRGAVSAGCLSAMFAFLPRFRDTSRCTILPDISLSSLDEVLELTDAYGS